METSQGHPEATFFDALSQMFTVYVPKKNSNFEDYPLCRTCNASAMGAVFDGCGGLGGAHYASFDGHTGAFIAARAVAQGCEDLFDDLAEMAENNQCGAQMTLAEDMKERIDANLRRCSSVVQSPTRLKGSLQKDFPTTLAAFYTYPTPGKSGLSTNILWAGDSRCYWLDANGLRQLTADDNEHVDALSNIHEDAALSNVISASASYSIHERRFSKLGKGVLIAATDGCFGYLQTPMHFEYLLLQTLSESSNIDQWQSKIADIFKEVSGDDATLVAQILQFDTFTALKSYFAKRTNVLERDYIDKYEADPTQSAQLWSEYQPSYSAYLKDAHE